MAGSRQVVTSVWWPRCGRWRDVVVVAVQARQTDPTAVWWCLRPYGGVVENLQAVPQVVGI